MRRLSVLVFASLACLAECALLPRSETAAPTSEQASGGTTFVLNQEPNLRFRARDASLDLLKAHLKYASALPPYLSKAVNLNPDLHRKYQALTQAGRSEAQLGVVQASPPPAFDSEYVIPVQVGTPPQSIPVNLDTGSSDFWTFSSHTKKWLVNGQTLYRPENSSSSFRLDSESWQIRYGDNTEASGIVYRDRVWIGDTFVDGQAVEAAVHVSPGLTYDSFSSGILGMANSAANHVSPTAQRTYIDNVKYLLAMPLFTASLQHGRPGNYKFGYIDRSDYQGEIKYADVDPYSPYWKITLSGYRVGDNDGQYRDYNWEAIVDTGTSLLLVPEVITKRYYNQVPGAGFDDSNGMFVFPCSVAAPDFAFGIQNYRGRIPGDYIKYGKSNETHCFGGIQPSSDFGFSILGDVALKAQFVVFNYGSAKVGFANRDLRQPHP